MSVRLTRDQLVEVVGGNVSLTSEKIAFEGVEFDSRNIKGGELFIALKGESEHGHKYVDQVLDQGAALCLVEDSSYLTHAKHANRFVVVDDSLAAFSTLAAWWREKVGLPVAAVTGSAGKTTVKELMAAILLRHGRGTFSKKSYNNHTGVPYTLCGINPEHLWAVIEMGMNNPGEIRARTMIAKPDIALITLIAPAHVLGLGSVAGIADAKFEIIDGLKPGGTLILNAEDTELRAALKRHDPNGKLKVLYFGEAEGCAGRATNIKVKGLSGISFTLKLGSESVDVDMPALGRHNAVNSVAAALAARTLIPSLPIEEIKEALTRFVPPEMRLRIRTIHEQRRIVDDSYNANPGSMRALLALARELIAAGETIGLVLGDMRELGDDAPRYHQEIAEEAASLKPAFIVAVGEFAVRYYESAKSRGIVSFHAESPEAAAHVVHKLPFSALLVKASRGVSLDRTVKKLLELEGEDISSSAA